MLFADELLKVDKILGAAACREVIHNDWHSLHVVDCQIGVRYGE